MARNPKTTYHPTNIPCAMIIDTIGDCGNNIKNNLKTTPTFSAFADPQWKIRQMVERELGIYEGRVKKVDLFSSLVGFLFFMLILYERQIK